MSYRSTCLLFRFDAWYNYGKQTIALCSCNYRQLIRFTYIATLSKLHTLLFPNHKLMFLYRKLADLLQYTCTKKMGYLQFRVHALKHCRWG